MNVFSVELIFLVAVVLNITALYVIIRKFFRKKTVSGKTSSWSIVTKIFSVVLNLALAFGVFWAVALGLWLISTDGLFFSTGKIYKSDFTIGLILLETAVFLPYGLNLLLYKFWYGKKGLSKWWTFPAIVIGAGAFIWSVFHILSENFINDWSKAKWIRR